MNKLNDLKEKLELAMEQFQENYIQSNPLLKASTERKIAQFKKEIAELEGASQKTKSSDKKSSSIGDTFVEYVIDYFKSYDYKLKFYPQSKNESAYFVIKDVPAHIAVNEKGELLLVEELDNDKLKFYPERLESEISEVLSDVNKIYNQRVAKSSAKETPKETKKSPSKETAKKPNHVKVKGIKVDDKVSFEKQGTKYKGVVLSIFLAHGQTDVYNAKVKVGTTNQTVRLNKLEVID